MTGHHTKQTTRRLLTGLFGAAACIAASAPGFAEEGTNAAANPAPAGGAGMTVYIDPQTGQILKEPAPGSLPLRLSPSESNAMSTSHEGLTETPSSAPGGGFRLDLKSRFQSPLIATVGADGKVKTEHLGEPPGADDKH